MPKQEIIPIWGGLNNANSPSATGLVDPVTNQQYNTGGLNVGDYFDLDEQQANQLSVSTVGTCHAGRYRYVQLDSHATAANVATGTVGYMRAGSFVDNVVITDAGTGATPGTYNIAATVGSGGGAGATIQVVVGAGGTITSAVVVNGGAGYVSVPSFSLTVTGTTGGTVAAQLNSDPNIVSSADQVAAGTAVAVRPVVFLNTATPGNYFFIQELGLATVLGKATSFTGTAAVGATIQPTTNGTVDVPTTNTTVDSTTMGLAVDLPLVSNLFKIYMGYAAMTVQG